MNKFMIHEFNFIKNATSGEDVAQATIAPKLYRKPKNNSRTIVFWTIGLGIALAIEFWLLCYMGLGITLWK